MAKGGGKNDNKTSTMAAGNQTNTSASSVGTAVVFNVAVFSVFILAFLALRPKVRRIYQPRASVQTIPERDRPRPLKKGALAWVHDLVTRPDSEILRDAGLDGYFFLRYLRFIFFVFLVGVIVLFPVLLAVNATGGNGQANFDLLSFSNVKNPNRFYAHVFLGWIYFGFILFSIYRELVYYVAVRQAVLTSPAYSSRLSSRSVLINTVPKEYLSVDAISSLFEGVKYVWINRNYSKLAKEVKNRDKLAAKVEAAENKLLKTGVKNKLKAKTPVEGDDIDSWVPQKKRPSHKLKPIIGKKVDTIEYGRENIGKWNGEILEKQRHHDEYPAMNSAFISFYTQEQAEIAFASLSHHRAFQMAPRFIGIRPDDVIWSNLRLLWWERLIRSIGAIVAISAVVIFWAIPVAFVGALSNIHSLMDKLTFLKFLNHLPKVLFGLVSSLLPTILLAVLMMLLPIFIRLMGRVSGKPTHTLVEYYTQNGYFAFQVVQVFLVTTLASGATAAVTSIIKDPSSAMSLLSENLPKASSFYISYFLLQGFTAAGGMLLQIVTLIVFYALATLLDGTPRKKWVRWNVLGGPGWGTVFPVYTNLAVIAITYSLISPLLLAFAAITFGLIYFAYLHNLMFIQMPTDGRGMYYARALYQTFTGLYLAEVCMLGLFVVAKSWGPIVLQAIFIAVTVFCQLVMQKAFGPLQQQLPKDLMRPTPINGGDKLQALQSNGQSVGEKSVVGTSGTLPYDSNEDAGADDSESGFRGLRGVSSKNIGVFTRYFAPHKFLTPEILQRDFLPDSYRQPYPELSDAEEASAFCHPAVNSENPVVWFPRDPWGWSATEVEKLRERDINASDAGAQFLIDDKKKKGTIVADGELNTIPIWEGPPTY